MSENQVDSFLICESCQISFDLEMREPKLLPCCRKAICKKCVKNLPPHSDRKCPLCRGELDRSVQFESKDQIIKDILKRMEDSKWEKCSEDGNNIQLFCEQDKMKVCSGCVYLNGSDCHGHNLSPLESLASKAKVRRGKYEDMLDDFEKYYLRLQGELVGNRKSMEELICKHFDENISKLERNKLKTLNTFNKACNEEKKEFEMHFGEESSVRNKLKEIISDHMNFRRIKNPIQVLEDDYFALHTKVNSLKYDDNNVQSFERQLSNISKNLQKQLDKQNMENEKTWGDFMTYITGGMKTQGLPGFKGTNNERFQRESVKITSNLEFTLKEGILRIAEQNHIKQEFSFEETQLQLVSELKFVFKNLDIENEDWEALSKLLNKVLENSKLPLSLCLKSENNEYSAAHISRLFTTFFQNPTKIISLKVKLYLNKDSMFLLHLMLLQLSNLKCLDLTFKRKIFQMESFESLVQSLKFLAKKLESLSLNFSRNQFKASELEKLQEIFIVMPVLKKFNLDVSETSLGEDFFAPLESSFNQLMPQLRELIINMINTQVEDTYPSSLRRIFKRIPKVDIKEIRNSERNGSLVRSGLQQIMM